MMTNTDRRWRTLLLASTLVLAAQAEPARAAVPKQPARGGSPAAPTITVTELRTEYRQNPVGLDARLPRLSWQLRSETRGVMQSAYQVRVAASERNLRAGRWLMWDSGRVVTNASVHRPYAGPPMQSGRVYYSAGSRLGRGRLRVALE